MDQAEPVRNVNERSDAYGQSITNHDDLNLTPCSGTSVTVYILQSPFLSSCCSMLLLHSWRHSTVIVRLRYPECSKRCPVV